MLADVAVDSYVLLMRILVGWLYGCARLTMVIIRIWTACDHAIPSNFSYGRRGLYINELMAKKFSLLGCLAMLLVVTTQKQQKKASFPGMLLEASNLSTSASLGLLIGRLLIASLFLYVGLSELHRWRCSCCCGLCVARDCTRVRGRVETCVVVVVVRSGLSSVRL